MKKGNLLLLIALLPMLLVAQKNKVCDISVMSFNIRLNTTNDKENSWPHRKDGAATMINFYAPDLFGTQEVLHNQLVDLKSALPQYTSVGVGRADGKEAGEYSAIFYNTSRFDQLAQGDFGLSEVPEEIGRKGWDAACERIVTWVKLRDKKTKRQFVFFNTHFDHVGQVARRESSKLLLAKAREIANDLPVVITGDFNATSDSEVITLIKQKYDDSRSIAQVKYGPEWTFHAFGRIPIKERSLIDYIFVSSGMQVKRHGVIADVTTTGFLSDHNPIIAYIQLP